MQSSPYQTPPEYIERVKSYRKIEDLIPAHWSEGMIEANGIHQHYYRTGGEKTPFILLHGFEEAAICWLRVAKTLEHDYDIIMIDARGHGLSDRATSGFTPELLTEDVASMIQALKLSRPHVLGFSMGSDTAIRLAATHPDLVNRVIVAGTSDKAPQPQAFVNSPGYQAWYQSFIDYLKALKTQTREERLLASLQRLLPPGAPLPPEEEFVPMAEASANLDINLTLMGNELWEQAAKQYQQTRQLLANNVTNPILLLYSEGFATPGATVTLHEEPSQRPNEKIIRFINAGHFIYRDDFEQFIEVVTSFLKES